MLRKILASVLLLATIFSLSSCGSEEFSHAELIITLPSGFSSVESDSYDLVMRDGDVSVSVLRVSLYVAAQQGIPDNLSPRAFAEYIFEARGLEGAVYDYKDIPYFTEYAESALRKLYTLYTFYRSKNAYFIILFTAPRKDEAALRESFLEYADTVKFTD